MRGIRLVQGFDGNTDLGEGGGGDREGLPTGAAHAHVLDIFVERHRTQGIPSLVEFKDFLKERIGRL